jgi:PilZ domain-containing protein
MDTSRKQPAIRRSTRLPLEIPVHVTSLDAAVDFSEQCQTTLVNAHGCGMIAERPLRQGIAVRLEIIPTKRHTTARVADLVSLGGDPETWLLGVELDHPGNFWGIEYAPADWRTDESLPQGESNPPDQEPAPAARPASLARRWRLTDISAGGCYLEGSTPFPAGTLVLVSIRMANSECLLDGVVRVCHAEFGMGVEFTPRVQDHRARVEQLIGRLLNQPEYPRVLIGRKERADESGVELDPTAASPEPESPDALLELIRNGDSLPLEQFQGDLKKQRLGKRREERIEVSLPVLLTGTDASGNPVQQMVTTCNVSRRGAQLKGVERKLRPGDTIFLTCGDRKEEFRVAWAGASLTPAAGQVGVVALELTTSLWDMDLVAATQPPREATSVRGMDSGGEVGNQN